MACILLCSSAGRVRDSQAYRKMDVTRKRISRILIRRSISCTCGEVTKGVSPGRSSAGVSHSVGLRCNPGLIWGSVLCLRIYRRNPIEYLHPRIRTKITPDPYASGRAWKRSLGSLKSKKSKDTFPGHHYKMGVRIAQLVERRTRDR